MIIRNAALAVVALALLCAPLARGQDTNAISPTNEPGDVVALVVSNMLSQADELASTNELSATNELRQADETASTNDIAQSNSPSQITTRSPSQNRVASDARSQADDRQSRRRDRQSAGQGESSALAGDTEPRSARSQANAPFRSSDNSGRPDFSNFALIAQRNIFDPDRRPHQVRSSGPVTRAPRVESFGLVGVMSYDKGTFAFFDGSRSDYQKALKVDDTIAGYRVSNIDAETVKLAAGTNQLELHVGMQLRREDEGEWQTSNRIETYAAGPASSASSTAAAAPAASSPTDAASGGTENEVLKRLMQRREQE